MNILITGGAGFIGSHLAESFLKEGHNLALLDNLTTGSLDNIKHLQEGSHKLNLNLVVDSILNRDVLAPLVEKADKIFHLAAAVGVKYIIDNPLSSLQTNVMGTEIILELACRFKKRIFIASTSEVYGKQTKAPLSEDSELVLGATSIGRWSYACGKALDEFLALAYFKEKKLPVTIFRFFNTVGPRQTGRYGMVIPRFIKQALLGQVITVYGDGSQTRTFCHVTDVIKAMRALSDREDTAGQVFNIGGVGEISILQLAEKIKSLAESPSEIKKIEYSEAYEKDFEDMPRRVPDLAKINQWIGYTPSYNLDDTILDILQFEKR